MSAEVETMFYLRKEPWHGLGTQVMEAPNSREALKLAGLDWKVVQEPLITGAEIWWTVIKPMSAIRIIRC